MGEYRGGSLLGPYILPPRLTLTSISSFYGRYFWNFLQMSLHLFSTAYGFNRTRRHLIMEGVYMTIWTEHFRTSGLGVVIPCLNLSDLLIYLLWILFSGMPWWALCSTCPSILKWNWWCEYLLLLLWFMKCLVFSNMSANPCRVHVHAYIPMAAVLNTSCDDFMFLFLFYNKAFYTTFYAVALLSLCLYLVRVIFLPMLFDAIVVLHDVLYILSKFIYDIQRYYIFEMYFIS